MRKTNCVTVVDVAREAHVSVATVSRVINNSDVVASETIDRVRKAIEKLDYTPNATARNLRRQESQMILVLAPNFFNPFYAHILNGISEAAQALGYNAFICGYKDDNPKDVLYRMLETHQAIGAILLASIQKYSWLEDLAKRYPIVQCAEYIDGAKVSSVSIDNYSAMREAIAYLVDIGHRRIGLITSKNDYISTFQREKGYRDELAGQIEARASLSIAYAAEDYTFKSGILATKELLDSDNIPTAIACVSDVLALGAISEIQRRGLSVPEDISIIGFDDVDYTKMFHPFLTTISQPCYDLGITSVNVLFELIRNKGGYKKVVLPYAIKIRETTCKPPIPTLG